MCHLHSYILQVIFDPLSADIKVPICFSSLSVSISGFFDGTTEIPVSFTLLEFFHRDIQQVEKLVYIFSLKPFILAIYVSVGEEKVG